MISQKLLAVICTFAVLAHFGTAHASFVEKVLKRIDKERVSKNEKFEFPIHWAKDKGFYSSDIHFNFYGPVEDVFMRRHLSVFDNNMFVSGWVAVALMEALDYDQSVKSHLDSHAMTETVRAILSNKDKNYPETAPVFTFWREKNENGTWVSYPTNLEIPINSEQGFAKWLHAALEEIHMEWLWDKVEPLLDSMKTSLEAFRIPSDADDTSLNLVVGSLLQQNKASFPEANSVWQQSAHDMQLLAAVLKKYAYQPFSSNSGVNTIDPRTYYWLRDFIIPLNGTGANPAFITTWFLDVNENRKSFDKNVAMPFNLNNVDVSVVANTLYGLIKYSLTTDNKDFSWFDADLQHLCLSSAKLLAYAVDQGHVDRRPDITLPYYPSKQDFYWFCSRLVKLIKTSTHSLTASPFNTIFDIGELLATSMANAGTKQLLSDIGPDGWAKGILGGADHHPHADDAYFTSAVTANALMDIWTDSEGKWSPSTPQAVKSAVSKLLAFLEGAADANDAELMNVVFSGSVKNMQSIPFAYPCNYVQYLNGTSVSQNEPGSVITPELICGVRGVFSPNAYATRLKGVEFQELPNPENFTTFNNGFFPFWSSRPLTLAFSLLAKVKYEAM